MNGATRQRFDDEGLHDYFGRDRCAPLLSPEREYRLARVMAWNRRRWQEEESELHRRRWLAARELFVRSNLRLVTATAKHYRSRAMRFDDLVQEGNRGLLTAADKFDPERGIKFSTYATWWIRQTVTRAVADDCRLVRLPQHRYRDLASCLAGSTELPPEERAVLERASKPWISLSDAYRDANDPVRTSEPPVDHRTEPAERVIDRGGLRGLVAELVKVIHPRNRIVLEMRFGLNGRDEATLGDIGAAVGVTRERVRQIILDCLAVLRLPSRLAKLQQYLD